jgi:hypothetical protein
MDDFTHEAHDRAQPERDSVTGRAAGEDVPFAGPHGEDDMMMRWALIAEMKLLAGP